MSANRRSPRMIHLRGARVFAALAMFTATSTVGGVVAMAPSGATDSNIITACGYDTTVGVSGGSCQSLPAALAAAQSYVGNSTIDLLPGDYCPIDLQPGGVFDYRVTLYGTGASSDGSPISYTGPEASLTTFLYNATFCGTTFPSFFQAPSFSTSAMIAARNNTILDGDIVLENLTLDGTGGPASGLASYNNEFTFKDVIVQNFRQYGVLSFGSSSTNTQVENSAIINNVVGVYASDGSYDESTFAGNTSYGIEAFGNSYFTNDTITQNYYGVYAGTGGTTWTNQIANSIVAGNTHLDCEDAGAFENTGTGRNLVGAASCPVKAANSGTGQLADVSWNGTGLTATPTTFFDDPTPLIYPPAQAIDAAEPGWCTSTGTDQRDATVTPGALCDIGAYDTHAVPPVVTTTTTVVTTTTTAPTTTTTTPSAPTPTTLATPSTIPPITTPTSVTPAVTPPKSAGPTPSLSVPGSALVVKGASFSLPVSCAKAACSGKVVLTEVVLSKVATHVKQGTKTVTKYVTKTSTVVLGSKTFSLKKGATSALTVTLTASGRLVLAHASTGHPVHETLALTIAGKTTTKALTLT